jgi:hypothetical protein
MGRGANRSEAERLLDGGLLPSPGRRLSPPRIAVSARAYSDDRRFEVRFEAGPALEQLGDEGLETLIREGWERCALADEVAWLAADGDNERDAALLQSMFVWLQEAASENRPSGFEVELDESAAEQWVRHNRPQLASRLLDS